MGIKRTNGSNQKGKKPLLINDLKILINAIDNLMKKIKEKLEIRALILIGFSGGFRRSEIVDMNMKIRICIRRS